MGAQQVLLRLTPAARGRGAGALRRLWWSVCYSAAGLRSHIVWRRQGGPPHCVSSPLPVVAVAHRPVAAVFMDRLGGTRGVCGWWAGSAGGAQPFSSRRCAPTAEVPWPGRQQMFGIMSSAPGEGPSTILILTIMRPSQISHRAVGPATTLQAARTAGHSTPTARQQRRHTSPLSTLAPPAAHLDALQVVLGEGVGGRRVRQEKGVVRVARRVLRRVSGAGWRQGA